MANDSSFNPFPCDMPCRFLLAVLALSALLIGAGCNERAAPMIPEMDEPLYVDGVQLNKKGLSGEALTAFLKVIDKRGDRGAPESHLEVGVIYLNHAKDPVLAYYHFKRYLELQPNSKEAPRVRGMLEAALRDLTRRFPGRPADDQSVRLAAAEEVAKLRRENDELRAELQTLRGGGAALAQRSVRMIALPDEISGRSVKQPTVQTDSPIVPAPAPVPTEPRAATVTSTPSAPKMTARPVAIPPRPASGRVHTVRQSEGLYAIARQFDPQNPGKKVREIVEANRDVLPNGTATPLKPGMTLRIP